jgi:hypothetical protein
MISKTDHRVEASVSPGLRTDAEHPESPQDDRQAKWRRRRLLERRGHRWTPPQRAILMSLLAIAMGSLFVTTYSLTLGDPIPRRINAAIVGDEGAHSGTVDSTERVAGGKLDFHPYPSLPAALHTIDLQNVMPFST